MLLEGLLDGATVHASGAIFQRKEIGFRLRPINIISILRLIDAFILTDRLYVPEENWNYFKIHAPKAWVNYLNECVRPVKIQHDMGGFKKFISDNAVFLILHILIVYANKIGAREQYYSYTGGDFGQRSYGVSDELLRMEKILRSVWSVEQKRIPWEYNHSDERHIDIIHAVWRGVKYSEYAAKNKIWYLPHEIRGQFIETLAKLHGESKQGKIVETLIKQIKVAFKEYSQKSNDDVANPFVIDKSKSLSIWEKLSVPLVSALVLKNTDNIYTIFETAFSYRKKARKFRMACANLEAADNLTSAIKFDNILSELHKEFSELDSKTPTAKYSISFSYPWGVYFNVEPSIKLLNSTCSLVRSFDGCKLLPQTVCEHIERVFESEIPDWFVSSNSDSWDKMQNMFFIT